MSALHPAKAHGLMYISAGTSTDVPAAALVTHITPCACLVLGGHAHITCLLTRLTLTLESSLAPEVTASVGAASHSQIFRLLFT